LGKAEETTGKDPGNAEVHARSKRSAGYEKAPLKMARLPVEAILRLYLKTMITHGK